jgi:hypothetical protein
VFDGLSFVTFGSSFSLGLIGSSLMGIAFAHWRYWCYFFFVLVQHSIDIIYLPDEFGSWVRGDIGGIVHQLDATTSTFNNRTLNKRDRKT